MKPPDKENAFPIIRKVFSDLFDIPVTAIPAEICHRSNLDCEIKVGKYAFLVDYKRYSSRIRTIDSALMSEDRNLENNTMFLIAVPYMGEAGRAYCHEKKISWLDLSGNAYIKGPDLYIRIEGRPNLYKAKGRPRNLFAPKSSRISMYLLLNPNRKIRQIELAKKVDLDKGFISKIIRGLGKEQYIKIGEEAEIGLIDPNSLLESWANSYKFDKHTVIKGHISAKSGDVLLSQVANLLNTNSIEYAATGLGAAWMYCKFAAFRTVTFYLKKTPDNELFELINFRKEESGSNTWIVIPNDEGVFYGSEIRDHVRCVNPVQTYLDLKEHPERSSEAAAILKKQYLNWEK